MARPAKYTFDDLIHAVLNGEVSLDYATAQAKTDQIRDELTLEVIAEIGSWARAAAEKGKWREMVKVWRLVLGALGDTHSDTSPRQLGRIFVAAADWIFIVTEALKDVPDGQLLKEAVAQGERAVELARSSGDLRWVGILETRLAALHVLPYIVRNLTVPAELSRWSQRLRDEFGGDLPRDSGMPEPLDALRVGTAHLEAALATKSNYAPGFAAKLLVDALLWRRRLGDRAIDSTRIRALANEALQRLPADAHDWRVEVAAALRGLGDDVDIPGLLSKIDQERPSQRDGTSGLKEEIVLIRALAGSSPAQAASRIENLWQSVADAGEEERKELIHLYGNSIVSCCNARSFLPSKLGRIVGSRSRQFGRAVLQLEEQIAASEMTNHDQMQMSLSLAVLASEFDAEDQGLALAQKALELAEINENGLSGLAGGIGAQLAVDHGATAWHSKNYVEAAKRYLLATASCLAAGFERMASDALLRAVEAIAEANFPVDLELALALATFAPAVEAIEEKGNVAEALRFTWASLIARAMEGGKTDTEILMLMMQGSKGALFSAALDHPNPWQARQDRSASIILDRLAQLSEGNETEEIGAPDGEQWLLSAIDDSIEHPGEAAAERVANLERHFDHLIRRRLVPQQAISETYPIIPAHSIADCLDERTAVLTVYAGRNTANRLALWAALIAGDRHLRVGQTDSGDAPMMYLGLEMAGGRLDDDAVLVASLREEIQIDAGRVLKVEEAAAALLGTLRRRLLGALEPVLAELHAKGFDHLAICPHGSTHFLPWHLLLRDEKPLADEWTVTHLPTLALLRRISEDSNARRPRSKAVAIGHTFKGNQPHSKRALPHVADELEQIRAACGAEILLDEAATEPAFARAAKEARWLHIATHGRNRTAAPAFQTVYLHPDADSDGRLCAYEVLAHDLRGVDLVTLSACETALGRIDISDNPRGLPACLFLAGASTIIGTLWEVNSEASALFFSTLYKRLAKGESKLAAFRTAQQVTRKQFPAYCHWGAFQYSGAW